MAVNFYWARVNRLLFEIGISVRLSKHNMDHDRALGIDHPAIRNDPNLPKAIEQSAAQIKYIEEASAKLFEGLKCDHIDRAAKAIGRWDSAASPVGWADLNARSRALRDAIETELKQYFYFQYPKLKGQKLKAWPDDWKRAIAAFPGIQVDVFAATDCYALGHNTASVFHSMRVAEHELRALAKERKIRLPKNKQIEWGTWQEIIKALDDEITLIGKTKKAGKAKDVALEFYSGARADLNGFKDEYRNQVSHVRASYDEFQALRALSNVNAFMERIAAKIDHSHHRIRWGLR